MYVHLLFERQIAGARQISPNTTYAKAYLLLFLIFTSNLYKRYGTGTRRALRPPRRVNVQCTPKFFVKAYRNLNHT